MDILCLMGLFPEEYETEVLKNSLSGVQNAANKLQWAIIEGLAQQPNTQLTVINSLYIGSYPKRYKKIHIPSFAFNVIDQKNGFNVGFLNLPGIKYISKYYAIKEKIDQWANDGKSDEKVVVAYAMTSPFVEILNYIKKKYPSIKCILFVPDLPEYMDVTNKSKIYSILKKMHISHLKKNIKRNDGYVFLTRYMKEWFDTDVRYVVIEGIYKESQMIRENLEKKEKVILYSGGLFEEYGVLELVEAFLKTESVDWKLELIGDGPLLSKLKQLSVDENRILIRGSLPNSEVLKRQREVSILVNPRRANQVFTRYSFPSKTIEYMASGTPMLGYKLPGIPDEYYRYIYDIKDDSNGLQECLENVMSISEKEKIEFGSLAKEFILREKNAQKQCSKIMFLIENIV